MKTGILKIGAIIIGAMVGCVALSAGIKFITGELIYSQHTESIITEDRAVFIALEHAGVLENQVSSVARSLTNQNGVQRYNVELIINEEGHAYGIDATSGEIIEYNIGLASGYTKDGNGYISEANAKEIALQHAGLEESEVTFVYVKLDYDDGVAEYEVEFWKDSQEYDYEINAMTGDIISYDFEIEHMQSVPNFDTSTFITEEKAKEIALQHAGLEESEVTFVYVKLDYDDGVAEYEVEFWSGNREYDYDIDAITGAILSFDYDIEHAPMVDANVGNNSNTNNTTNTNNATNTNNTTNANTTNTSTYITQEKAKEIALAHAGLAENSVTFIKVELEYDDGRAEYEVEFWSGNTEYDYEINATTGDIISFDYDVENYTLPNTSSGTTATITAEKAKEIALNHAGVTSANAGYIKCELDYDDGRVEYEIEWQIGRTEYEYTIDATSGTILEFDVDKD